MAKQPTHTGELIVTNRHGTDIGRIQVHLYEFVDHWETAQGVCYNKAIGHCSYTNAARLDLNTIKRYQA